MTKTTIITDWNDERNPRIMTLKKKKKNYDT
jgi:hypothetical protein